MVEPWELGDLELLLAHLPVMVAVYGPEGRVTWVNRVLVDTLGWSQAEWLEEDLLEACYPDPVVRREAIEFMTTAPGAGEARSFRTLTKTGATLVTRWWVVRLPGERRVGVGVDESAEEELRRAQRVASRRLEMVLRGLDGAVLIADERDRLVMVNAQARRWFGLGDGDVRGLDWATGKHVVAKHFAEPERFVACVEKTLSELGPSRDEELRLTDGRILELDFSPVTVDGIPRGAFWHYRDVTALREARRLERRHLVQERMVSVGQLAAGVAHEINNPVAFVTANLERLAAELEGLDGDLTPSLAVREARAIVKDCLDGSRRVQRIASDLGSFSHIDTAKVEAVDLAATVRSACNLVKNQIRHRARLSLALDEAPPIAAHPGRVAQVFVNLLMNAAQAIEPGAATDHEIGVHLTREAQHVRVAVKDDGVGMSAEVRDRIFEPFFTTKPRGIGTGLGLSLAADIVRAHGGAIDVVSALGEGTTVTVSFPIHTRLAPKPGRSASAGTATRSRKRLLFIDDETALLRAYRRTVGRDHEVVLFDDAAEALERLATDDAFDQILCDLMMPNMDGVGFYRAVQDRYPHLVDRITFVTGGAFSAHSKRFITDHDVRVVGKPLDLDELFRLLG